MCVCVCVWEGRWVVMCNVNLLHSVHGVLMMRTAGEVVSMW